MNLFDISKLEISLSELEKKTMEDGFWNDNKTSSKILSEIKTIKFKCIEYKRIITEISNLRELTELVSIEPDDEVAKEILDNTIIIKKRG